MGGTSEADHTERVACSGGGAVPSQAMASLPASWDSPGHALPPRHCVSFGALGQLAGLDRGGARGRGQASVQVPGKPLPGVAEAQTAP